MNEDLRSFAERMARSDLTLDEFLQARYRELGLRFPHPVFSVNQATTDFFPRLLMHLNGGEFDKLQEVSEYEANYRRWVKSHL